MIVETVLGNSSYINPNPPQQVVLDPSFTFGPVTIAKDEFEARFARFRYAAVDGGVLAWQDGKPPPIGMWVQECENFIHAAMQAEYQAEVLK